MAAGNQWPVGEPGWDTDNALPASYALFKADFEKLVPSGLTADEAASDAAIIAIGASAPSDVTEGKHWYDTGDKQLKASNGSAYIAHLPEFNVGLFGAPEDGTDASAAILAAIAAAGAAGGGRVTLGPFTYGTSAVISIEANNVWLVGAGQGATAIKQTAGADLDDIVRLGVASGAGQVSDCGVMNMTIDGNESNNTAASPGAALRCYNATSATVENLYLKSSEGVGLLVTSGDAGEVNGGINLATLSKYQNIHTQFNVLGGVDISGVKYCTFSVFNVDNNNEGFGAWIHQGIGEMTQCNFSDWAIDGNGDDAGASERAGLIVQGAYRCNFTNFGFMANGGAAISFRDGDSAVVGLSTTNSELKFSNVYMRRNGDIAGQTFQGIECQSGSIGNSSFDGITIRGPKPTNADDMVGISIDNCTDLTFTRGHLSSIDGTPIKIDGGASQSKDIFISLFNVRSCGEAGATNNHGIWLLGNVNHCVISDCIFENDLTTAAGGGYEMRMEGTGLTNIQVNNCFLFPGDAGREVLCDADAADDVRFSGVDDLSSQNQSSTLAAPAVGGIYTTAEFPLWAAGDHVISLTAATTAGDINGIPVAPTGTIFRFLAGNASPAHFKHQNGGGNLILAGGADIAPVINDITTLVCRSGSWYGPV